MPNLNCVRGDVNISFWLIFENYFLNRGTKLLWPRNCWSWRLTDGALFFLLLLQRNLLFDILQARFFFFQSAYSLFFQSAQSLFFQSFLCFFALKTELRSLLAVLMKHIQALRATGEFLLLEINLGITNPTSDASQYFVIISGRHFHLLLKILVYVGLRCGNFLDGLFLNLLEDIVGMRMGGSFFVLFFQVLLVLLAEGMRMLRSWVALIHKKYEYRGKGRIKGQFDNKCCRIFNEQSEILIMLIFIFIDHQLMAERGSGCYQCGEPGHFARECPKNNRENDRTCYNCGGVGHKARQCPSERKGGQGHYGGQYGGGYNSGPRCYNCGRNGHFAKDCNQSRSAAECFSCHKEGHLAKDCPEGDRKTEMECRRCHEKGHFAKECRN